MTNDPLYTHLRQLSWRRHLTAAEQAELRAWLAAHPEAQADWEAEARLNEALGRLPDAPLPSNFTARVLETVHREAAAPGRGLALKWPGWQRWQRWLPKAAVAAVVLGAGLVSYNYMVHARYAEFAGSVVAVADVSSLPGPDILKDFDAIQALDHPPAADEELLRLLE